MKSVFLVKLVVITTDYVLILLIANNSLIGKYPIRIDFEITKYMHDM